MRYSEVIKATELVLMGDDVPLIIGESGIGKTSLVKELSKKNNYAMVNIDANLLKEGEIGGLPIVKNGQTIYATHHKLIELDQAIEKGKEVLLFIDELNRCEHAVQQELMNLIINREINGYKLNNKVKIVGAMNPSNKYNGYEESDYQIVDMDAAQEDRFVWLNMDSDVKEWIKWGMESKEITEEIIEFISTFPEYLSNHNTNEDIKATPRSWHRVNRAYRNFRENREKFSKETLYNVIKGNIGTSIATDFINFINNRKETIATPENILSYDYIPFDIRDILSKESHSRLYVLAKGCLNKLESDYSKINVFSQLLKIYPKDLRLGIMKEIKKDCSNNLYRNILENDDFIEAFFNIYEKR